MDNHTEKQEEDLRPASCFSLYLWSKVGTWSPSVEVYTTIFSKGMYKEMGTDEYYGQDITLNVLGLSSTH